MLDKMPAQQQIDDFERGDHTPLWMRTDWKKEKPPLGSIEWMDGLGRPITQAQAAARIGQSCFNEGDEVWPIPSDDTVRSGLAAMETVLAAWKGK